MNLIWGALAAVVLFVGFRHRQRLSSNDAAPRVDDAAIRSIIDDGRLMSDDDDDRLDIDAAAQAEEEFLDEYWDAPDED